MNVRTLLVVGLTIISLNADGQTAGYSALPLQKPVMDTARVLVESIEINNWLNVNSGHLTQQQRQSVREHLHALIDSRVKEMYLRERAILPKGPDPVLAMLYAWGGRLGVFGADQVYARIKGDYSVQPPAGPRAPMGLDISLKGDALKVTSGAGRWEVSFPYHFFVFEMQNSTDAEGRRLEAIVVSTGSAPDVARPGYSQATIAVFSSPETDIIAFANTWTARLGVPPSAKEEPVGASPFKSRKHFDGSTRLRKEVVFIPSAAGSIAVLYAGLDGAYQWNRPHFVDFLDHLKVARP